MLTMDTYLLIHYTIYLKTLTADLLADNLEFGEGIPDDEEFWSNKLADPCLAYRLLALLLTIGNCCEEEERFFGLAWIVLGCIFAMGVLLLIVVVEAL